MQKSRTSRFDFLQILDKSPFKISQHDVGGTVDDRVSGLGMNDDLFKEQNDFIVSFEVCLFVTLEPINRVELAAVGRRITILMMRWCWK